MTSQQRMRIVSCPACEHEGAIPKEVPTTATLRCRSCRERWLVREATGPRPCRRRRRTAADLKRRTVRFGLARRARGGGSKVVRTVAIFAAVPFGPAGLAAGDAGLRLKKFEFV